MDEVTDTRLIYKWFKDICEVTKYLHSLGISELVMDGLSSDNIFITHENQIKIDILECAIDIALKSASSSTGSEVSLTIDESEKDKNKLNTYPLGTF